MYRFRLPPGTGITMQYRSDWAETGLSVPFTESLPQARASEAPPDDTFESRVDSTTVRWIASQDPFESRLYDFPIWQLRLELDDADKRTFENEDGGRLEVLVGKTLAQLLESDKWKT